MAVIVMYRAVNLIHLHEIFVTPNIMNIDSAKICFVLFVV